MKRAWFLLLPALLTAAQGPQFEITDARGKKAAGVSIQAGEPDADGWFSLSVKAARAKGEPVLIWPFDGTAKLQDGPEPIPAIVIQRGDAKALENQRVVAAMATPVAMGVAKPEEIAMKTGFDATALNQAFLALVSSSDALEKGVGLLFAKKPADAAPLLAQALRERQRQLTRVPSEIYPAAVLDGEALAGAKKFDEAAVAFLVAVKQRPSSALARKLRSDALTQAGKPEAE